MTEVMSTNRLIVVVGALALIALLLFWSGVYPPMGIQPLAADRTPIYYQASVKLCRSRQASRSQPPPPPPDRGHTKAQ